MTTVESEIRSLLIERLGLDPAMVARTDVQTPLLGRGFGLDSVEAMALAAALESRLGLRLEDHELTVDTFRDIATLVAIIDQKLRARAL